jgi:hypothetical protein
LRDAQRESGERSGRGGNRSVNGVLERSLVRETSGKDREGDERSISRLIRSSWWS